MLGSFIEDEFACYEGCNHSHGDDDVDGDVAFIARCGSGSAGDRMMEVCK